MTGGWTYSPVPAVEAAVSAIRDKYPASYPAGLDRVRSFLAKLGNPHTRLPFVFHAAGTNGKGSTLAFVQAALEAGGKRVHKYTSPHLVRFEERIVLGGEMIAPDELLALIAECDRAAAGEEVSFFEFFTALAFLAFSRHPADALLLETGLGGTFDATNVVAGPNLVSLLTRISYDHTHVLGKTLAEIARNKAGIIKPGCAVVVAPQSSPEVLAVLGTQAVQVQCDAQGFDYAGFRLPLPGLTGRHQVDNAATALAAIAASPYKNLLQQDVLENSMRNVRWAGRMQRLQGGALSQLLPAGWELWLDGAHNDSGAEILVEQAKAWGNALPLHLVTAMKRTKDATAFYKPLMPYLSSVQAMDVSHIEAPMLSAESLAAQLGATVAPSLHAALTALVAQYKTPQRVLVTGSLYLVGQALREEGMS